MPLVTSYTHLRRQDEKGRFLAFQPLRAVGLAVEQGHKLAKRSGLGALTTGDVSQVKVSGTLQLLESGRWGEARKSKCDLQLRDSDAELAKAVVVKQRDLLADLKLNIYSVDVKRKAAAGSFDLLGDFSSAKNWGVTGLVWVELKVWSAAGFDEQLRKLKGDLVTALAAECAKNQHLGGVLLLAAKVEQQGSSWHLESQLGILLVKGSTTIEDFVVVAGGARRVGRGKKTKKPALTKIWPKVEWVSSSAGRKVGLVNHFLGELGLKAAALHPGEKAVTLNKWLLANGHSGKVFQDRCAGTRAGKEPWVASKETLTALYNGYF